MVVTEEQYKIATEIERIARNYTIPRSELLTLGRAFFEAGQRDGLTSYAVNLMSKEVPAWQQ